MKIVEINSHNFGSTGRIMQNIAIMAKKRNHAIYTALPDGRSMKKVQYNDQIYIGNRLERNLHIQLSRLTGFDGCFSQFGTAHFLKRLADIGPDILHLHNLHNCYINLAMLFCWIKATETRVIWTLHDCWAFTGKCPYFEIARCEKWLLGCHHCPQCQQYPTTLVDKTRDMYMLKKKWFTGIKNLTIVTPSKWLAGLIRQSFLSEYPLEVINNGIDLDVFKPIDSNFRQLHGIPNKFVLLGVAFGWGYRKGLDVFIQLAHKLDSSYQIVLVGVDEKTATGMPDNIIAMERTNSAAELAMLYTMADLFVNPTREDNFPTVNMEALACGTPVVTFTTGGSPEIIDESCGMAVPWNDVDALVETIDNVRSARAFQREACIARARAFDMKEKFAEYVNLYEKVNTVAHVAGYRL